MLNFEKRSYHVHIIAWFIGLAAVGFVVYHFYLVSSSPTDENLFTTTPSNIYITKPIHLSRTSGGDEDVHFLQAGDILVAVNGIPIDSARQVGAILESMSDTSEVRLTVFHPSTQNIFTHRVLKKDLPATFYRQIPPSVFVIDVEPGGASDRAGMRVGDVIIKINGKSFTEASEADAILRRGQTGKTLEYEILRNNKRINLHVVLARLGFSIDYLAVFLCGLLYIAVGFFIIVKRPRIRAAFYSGLALLIFGLLINNIYMWRIGPNPVFGKIKSILLVASVFFGIAVMFHSRLYFPKERRELLRKKWVLVVLYVLALAGTISTLVFAKEDSSFYVSLSVLLLYVVVVSFVHRSYRSEEQHRQARILNIATIIVAVMFLASLLMRFLGFYSVSLIYIVAGQSLLPLAYLYTIGRYGLLDLNIRPRRNIQYTIATWAWGLGIMSLVLWIIFSLPNLDLPLPNILVTATNIQVLDTPPDPEQKLVMEKAAVIILGIIVFYAGWIIRKKGQQYIDRKFHQSQYDYRRAASELAEVMAANITMIDLARGIVDKLAELMHLKRAGVLFFEDEKMCTCHQEVGFSDEDLERIIGENGEHLVHVIKEFKAEIHVDYLPEPLKGHFRKNEIQYIIPIYSKARLVGALFIGEKLSEASFKAEDLAFLSSTVKQASVSIENAFLYEELAEKERLKHELDIARSIQMASLPQATPIVPGLDISGKSIPAFEVGGDYYDYLNEKKDTFTVIVGDVSGKGTSAALYMSKIQGVLRSLHGFGLSPAELFIKANQLLYNDMERKAFFTAIGARFELNKQRMVIARAGHLPLYRYNATTKRMETILPRGLGLGLDDKGLFTSELEEQTIDYKPGDIFLFITDGITEAFNSSGQQYGESTLMRVFSENISGNSFSIRDAILDSVAEFASNGTQYDDQTIVVIKAI
ncbi:MAG: SpoIIE family protein phosphatase [Chlorobi bacterium]|nr:SpoIIE family protein phosphatase [Chlorobiota bacterium]